MASRVNVKFLSILLICLFLVVGILGGLWYLQRKGDTERHIRLGNEYMQAGQFRDAYDTYGRAVAKQPANLEYLQLMENALMSFTPVSRDDARELYARRIGILKHAARYHRLDAGRHKELIDELVFAARLSKGNDWWEQVEVAADDMWTQLPPDDPARLDAQLYRGMSLYRRAVVLPDRELIRAEDDLTAYLEAHPNSDEAWGALLTGYLTVAQKDRAEGNNTGHEEMMAKARESFARAQQAGVDGPNFARATVLYRAITVPEGDDPENLEPIRDAAQHMIDEVQQSGDPLLIEEAAEVLISMPWLGFTPQAIEMLESHLAVDPDAHIDRYMLATLQFRNGDLDESERNVKRLLALNELEINFISLFQDVIQLRAASLQVDIAHQRWERAELADKPAKLAEIERAVAELRPMISDPENDPVLIRAEGKLAFASGDYRTAAAKFDHLARGGRADSEVLLYCARSLEQINETGLAYERAQQLQAIQPSNPAYLYECGRLAYKMKNYDAALTWLDQLLEVDPGSAIGRQLAGRIRMEQSGEEPTEMDPLVQVLADATAALKEGNTDSARAALLSALDGNPDNPQIVYALMQVEISAGEKDKAIAYLDQLIEMQPQNTELQAIRYSIANEDRIKAIEQFVASRNLSEGETAVTMLINLTGLARAEQRRSEQLDAAGNAEQAEAARELASRAETEAQRYLAQAEKLAPDNPRFQEHLFQTALIEEDWKAAEAVVERARTLDTDLAGGRLLAGQLDLARGNLQEAIIALNEAVQEIPHSSLAWRNLAIAYERVGNFVEARTAYEQAYRNNPTDVDAVRRYIALLLRSGDETRALRVVRSARRLLPGDVPLREAWLQLESRAGDPVLAFKERRMIYTEAPKDQENAMQLARLLATTPPERQLLLDESGEPEYSESRWARLGAKEQARILEQARNGWEVECDQILTTLGREESDEFAVVALRADLLRERGQVDAGERTLRDFIAGKGDQATIQMLVTLAQYQDQAGRSEQAAATLDAARSVQDPIVREADVALGDLYFRKGLMQEAVVALERAIERRPDRNVQLRIVECQTRLGNFGDARRRLEALTRDGGAGYYELMLMASIADGEARQAYAVGNLDEATARVATRNQAIAAAAEAGPTHPEPHIQQAQWLLAEFNRSVESADPDDLQRLRRTSPLLADAMRELMRADEIQAGNLQTSLTRVALLQTQGDMAGAIGELNRVLAKSPDEVPARRQLVQLLYQQGEADGAYQAIQEGVARNPSLVMWHELQGDLFLDQLRRLKAMPDVSRPKLAEAAQRSTEGYGRATQIRTNPLLLGKLVSSLFEAEPPDYKGAVQVLLARQQMMDVAPALRCLYAEALQGLGRRDEAKEQLLIGFGRFKSGIAEGKIPAGNISIWHGSAERVFKDQSPQVIESFVMELTDQNPDPVELNWLAMLWARSGTDGISRALELQQQAIDRYQGNNPAAQADLYFRLGSFLLADGQYDAALAPLSRVIELAPNSTLALNNYAFVLAKHLGRPGDALPYAERAASLLNEQDPIDLRASILDTLGWIQFRLGDSTEAETLLRRSINVKENANNRLHLAMVLAAAGNFEGAQTHLDRAAQLRPSGETRAEIEALAVDVRNRRIPDRGGD